MFKITNKIITTRVNVSLNNFPPIILGKLTYHAEIAVKYQTFTNVCPKLQNNVRLSITLTVSVHPKAQGISISTSAVTPIVPKNNNTNIPSAKNASNGICFPGFLFLQLAIFINAPNSKDNIPKPIITTQIQH